jgi:hypothetical protein
MTARTLTALTLAVVTGTAYADLESDFAVGTDGAGKLKFEFNFDSIEPLVFNAANNVWISDEPGFANLDVDEPDEGFFVLPSNAFITIEILSVDAGFRVLDPEFDSFTQTAIEATVTSFDLGSPDFDDHPFWAVLLSEWDGVTTSFDVTLRAVDSGAGLLASDPVTATFVIPSPGVVSVLAAGGLLASRRRRA